MTIRFEHILCWKALNNCSPLLSSFYHYLIVANYFMMRYSSVNVACFFQNVDTFYTIWEKERERERERESLFDYCDDIVKQLLAKVPVRIEFVTQILVFLGHGFDRSRENVVIVLIYRWIKKLMWKNSCVLYWCFGLMYCIYLGLKNVFLLYYFCRN